MPNARVLTITALSLALLGLGGCSGLYEVTLNDRLVYNPFGAGQEDGPLEDANLQGCVNELINRSEAADADDIKLLACSAAGISSLYGIYALPDLEQLELSDNNISDLSPLSELDNLRVLSLRNNNVRDIRPVLNHRLLRFVSLQGNNNVSCRQLDQLEAKIGGGLGRPLECVP